MGVYHVLDAYLTYVKSDMVDNIRILKNTIFLYCRMFIIMAVSLFASRVTLAVLGVEDYGIYDVVGGVVVMFSFFSSALNSATQRFLSVELGKNDLSQYNRVFNSCIYIYILLAVIIIVLAETVGLWFLNNTMNFPHGRIEAANWVYQFSIITFVLNIIRTPFNASIIANEKMSFFAYTSIVEVCLKLGLVLLLYYTTDFDKLKLYALLISIVAFILLIWYLLFCLRTIPGCVIQKNFDKVLTKRIFSFSGWSLMGSAAVITTNQGVNMLLNIFCGVAVNASMGIANQVSQVVNQFTANFQLAFAPQITKAFDCGSIEYHNFVFRSSRLSFFLLFLIALPILFNVEFILDLWLIDVPNYAAEFCLWMIISMLLETLSAPLYLVVQAEGKIRNYQIIVSLLFALNIALSYVFLSFGYQAVIVVVIRVIVSLLLLLFRVIYISYKIEYKVIDYFSHVIKPIIRVVFLSFIFPVICTSFGLFEETSMMKGISKIAITVFLTSIIIYVVGLKKSERIKLSNMIVDKVKSLFG